MARRSLPLFLSFLMLSLTLLACSLDRVVEDAVATTASDAQHFAENAAATAASEVGQAVQDTVDDVLGDLATSIAPQPETNASDIEGGSNPTLAHGNDCPLTTGHYVEVPPDITRLNLRSGPGTDFPSVGYVVASECYEVLLTQDNWASIVTDVGPGWVSLDYTQNHLPNVSPPSSENNVISSLWAINDMLYRYLDSPPGQSLDTLLNAADLTEVAAIAARLGSAGGVLGPVGYGMAGINVVQCHSPRNTDGNKPCHQAAADIGMMGSIGLMGLALGVGAAATAPAWAPFAFLAGVVGLGVSAAAKYIFIR